MIVTEQCIDCEKLVDFKNLVKHRENTYCAPCFQDHVVAEDLELSQGLQRRLNRVVERSTRGEWPDPQGGDDGQ